MIRRLKIACLLFAWFAATGAQWDLVQVYGWARMIASYAETMPLAAAVKKTFDGEMCGVCQVVQEAKSDFDSSGVPGGKVDLKLPLVLEPLPVVIVAAPTVVGRQAWEAWEPVSGRAPPPLPPPRV